MVEIWRVLNAVSFAESVTGFWPPMTAMNPKGMVAARVTFPVKPFRLVRMMLVVLDEPAVLVMDEGSAWRWKLAVETTATLSRVELE